MSESQQTNPFTPNPTYCVSCDSAGACAHDGGLRYEAEIVYEKTSHGWSVPQAQRARFDSDRWSVNRTGTTGFTPSPPMLLRDLLSVVEHLVFVDERMQAMLQDCYAANAAQTSLLVMDVARASDQLSSPGGLLVSRMRKLLAASNGT